MEEYAITWRDVLGNDHRIVVWAKTQDEAMFAALRAVKGLSYNQIIKVKKETTS